MSSTTHLALPLIAAAQAQKHVTHNEALAALDALVQLAVKERGRNAPPASPAEGDRYLVGTEATGAFAGQAGHIALFDLGAWRFFTPHSGWLVYVEAEDLLVLFDGADWKAVGAIPEEIHNLQRLGLGAVADGLNRLSAKLNAALFAALSEAEGGTGDLRFVLNKSAETDVLSQLYQRAFSGRAETGLIGSDDFRIRVSPDGSEWRDALLIERASGIASFPCGVADVPRPNLLVNAGFLVNQRRFAGGPLAAGSYGFDRWRAGPSGCALNRAADGTITLSGAVEQVVEVAQALAEVGIANFAGAALTLSMEDLSAPLPVFIGTKAVTIPAGSGRRSASVTLEAGETGNVLVRLQPAGTCTFKRMKLEVGSHATAWAGIPLELEEFRCRRTFQRLPVSTGTTSVLLAVGQRIGGTMIDLPVAVPVSLRADPIIVTSGFAWSNGSPSGNQVSFFNNSAANWASLTGALTLTSVTLPSVSGVVLRFQAGTSFSGVAGAVGHLHFGSQAFIALQAEP